MFRFVDCQGLGGAWTLGTVQTGEFELIHRASLKGGFGDESVELNRRLLGESWRLDPGHDADSWEPQTTSFVCGTPPCSGFSNANTTSERGPGAPINRCMRQLVEYGGHCTGSDGKPGAEIVAFESVQAAYTKGRILMQTLRDLLESLTGQEYDLHHVKMSGGSIGAAQYRHRYFPVFSRIPFGVDPPTRDDLPDKKTVTYFDAIGDLQGLAIQWESQPRTFYPTGEFGRRLCDSVAVSQHVTAEGRLAKAAQDPRIFAAWPAGKYLSEAFDISGIHPEEFQRNRRPEGIRRGDSTYKGLQWPLKINPNKSGYVQTGGCAREFAHWAEPRLLTIRELTRMMGYPDSWEWPEKITRASMEIGKCCPVDSGRWISNWAARALHGTPGRAGTELQDGNGELFYDFTHLYKKWF